MSKNIFETKINQDALRLRRDTIERKSEIRFQFKHEVEQVLR